MPFHNMLAVATILMSSVLIAPASSRTIPSRVRAKVVASLPNATLTMTTVLSRLKFRRDGKIVRLAGYSLPTTFANIDGGTKDLTRILLDPTYIDPSHTPDQDDFTILIGGVKPMTGGKTLSSFALCKWGPTKTSARCGIEDDGGAFEFIPHQRGTTLQNSRFVMAIDSTGFRIGDSDDGTGRGAITVRNDASGGVTNADFTFK